jgi:hypothetical protein
MPRMWAVMLGIVVVMGVDASLQRAGAQDPPATRPANVPVDFHKLQELMPAAAVGVTRSDLGGENVEAGAMTLSRANADYTKPDSDGSDPHASIEITDYAAAPQMVAGMTAWRQVPINVQNDQGHTRTVKLKNHPAMEVYTKDGDSRQMIVLVAERFLVNIETTHVPEAEFKKLIEALPLDKLAALK